MHVVLCKPSKIFLGEAVNTAAYIINRSPSIALNFKTPQELWFGKTPKLNHMRIFGYAAYAHTRQDKLDPRAEKCMFLGYPSGVKGYILWSLEKGDNKVFISRDVLFNESLMPWKESQTSKNKPNVETSGFEIDLIGSQ